MSAAANVVDDVGSSGSSSSNADSGETQEAPVLSRGGVDLALVSSWSAEGQDATEARGQRQELEQTRRLLSSSPPSSVDAKNGLDGDSGQIGRCLCSEEEEEKEDVHGHPPPAPQQKPASVLVSAAPPVKKSVSLQQQPQPLHIVPNVVHVSAPAPSAGRQVRIATGNHHQPQQPPPPQQQQQRNSTGPSKPILSRKNWNNTIDSSGRPVPLSHHNQQQLQHSASCLKRYGSQQSCRSATTLRSYVSTSRGKSQHSYSGGRSEQPSQSEGDLADDALSGHEEKIPGGPGLNERELWSLHRAVPGLRRHDPRTSTIRQHYYPEGGWGWLVVGAAFLVQVLTTGLQLAFGVMAVQIGRHFRRPATSTITAVGSSSSSSSETAAVNMEAVWIGVMQLSGSWLWAPLVVALCRRKSTRLTAVLGGLVLALAALFASFAQQIHQVFLSYGALMSIAVTLVRESSALMVGQYFKRRRDFVEIVVQMGAGIGVILFAVFFKEALGQLGWRLGLQAATGLLLTAFFLGTFYRSASLYHPQRRAILHLKTQRKKVKVKGKPSNDRPPYFDFSVLRLKSLRMILLSSGIGAIGAYTPLFYLALQGEEDGLEASDLLLIHTFVGLAMSAGTVIVGLIVLRPGPQCLISLQYLCQATLYGIGVSMLVLASVTSYHGYALFAWMYGFCLGGYQYALHQYTLDRVRARQFARGWSLVLAVRALPALFGIPITGYINQSTPRAGYYFSFTFTVVGASLLFFTKLYRHSTPPALFLGAGRRSAEGHHRKRPSSSSEQPSRAECSGAEQPSGGQPPAIASVSAAAAAGGIDAAEDAVPMTARVFRAESVSRDAASQEPLIYRGQQQQQLVEQQSTVPLQGILSNSTGSNGGGLVRMASSSAIRTVHQDVCTCPKPPFSTSTRQQQHQHHNPKHMRRETGRRKSLGQRIVAKLGLNTIPWKLGQNNPLTNLFNSHSTVDMRTSGGGGGGQDSPPLPPLPASILQQQKQLLLQQQQRRQPVVTANTVSMPDYPFAEVEWDAEYWNGCVMGSCNHLDDECECVECAECGLPLDFDMDDYDEEEVDEDDDCLFEDADLHMHPHPPLGGGVGGVVILPDAVEIPELPPEVKRQRARMALREMSISDPEHLQKIGRGNGNGNGRGNNGRRFYDIGVSRLPSKLLLLRRQNTWHDVSILAPPGPPSLTPKLRTGVDVIEQITTSV